MLYKLTDSNDRTFGGTQWGPGVTHTATGSPNKPLCSNAWIHAYEHPLLAVLLNPIHANFRNPHLWEAEGIVEKQDGQLKCGCRSLKTTRQIPLPHVTTEQKVRFAILCGLQVCTNAQWRQWAENWLTEKDRTEAAARAAAEVAWAAAEVAARAAWAAAEVAARAAAEAAEAAAEADLIALAERACANE